MKTLHLVVASAAALATVGVLLALYANYSLVAGESYYAGNFAVHVLEDSNSRFLARLENNGAAINNAAAFAVKKGLNENCEPQGIVVANFQVRSEQDRLVPEPDYIPANSSVTLDSRQSENISVVPTGPNFETAVYVLGLEPGTIRANQFIEKISIHELDSTELELFEDCQQQFGGYPLQLKILNPPQATNVYVTATDESNIYEAALEISPEAPDLNELFWPPSRNDWLSGNHTHASGPAPAWTDAEEVNVSVRVISLGRVSTFEDTVTPRLVTTSLDFFQAAKGDRLPSYPKYWEIQIDLENRTIS